MAGENKSTATQSEAVAISDIVRPWVGKLRHSRELFDDWGWLKDESGQTIIMVRIPPEENNTDKLHEHRKNKTDPTQTRVDAILALLNGPNATTQAPL